MPPEVLAPGRAPTALPDRLSPHWRTSLLRLVASLAFAVLLFLPDWQAMARQWWDSSTYNHILLVPAIIGWLVWLRVPQLAGLRPTTWWPGLVMLVGAALLWLLGALSGLDLARHIGAVAMIPVLVVTLLGPRIGWGLAFPLTYSAFLVPFGDELVPPMQMITADITSWLTRLSGIPAEINGVFIDTPAGLFVVAEACSGVKFLIAMIAFGVLVAHVCFISWTRRALFIALALAVPILANGIRAWGTIYLAQIHGVAWAAGFDHIVYGWVFFAIVIALVLALAWRFFDRSPDDCFVDPDRLAASPVLGRLERQAAPPLVAMLAIVLVGLGANAWATAADRLVAPVPAEIALPEVAGWKRVDYAPSVWWEPRAAGAEHRLLGSYGNRKGQRVDVFYALYSAQGEGREAGGFGQGALMPDGEWDWVAPGPVIPDGRSDRLMGQGRVARVAETYFRSGALFTGSNVRLKLAAMRDRLILRERPTAMLILSAESRADQQADGAIEAFRRSVGPLDAWMDRIAQVR
jgi:exosortase A